MDFTYSEEQRMLADSLRRFVEHEYTFAQRRTRSLSGFDPDIWEAPAEMGALGLSVPVDYGGFDEGSMRRLVVQREFGRALVAEPVIPATVCAAVVPEKYDTPAQKDQWFTSLAGGTRNVAVAWQATYSRHRPESVCTVAKRANGGDVLNGSKSLVWHDEIADALIADSGELALFLVAHDVEGLSLKGYPTMDGLRAADLMLANVTLSSDVLIGLAGDRLAALGHPFDHGVAALCAKAAGAMEQRVEVTSVCLRERRQFGAPLASFQALQHCVAGMLIQKELALSMAYVAIQALDEPAAARRARMVSAAEVSVARARRFVSQQAVQLHGGMGMTDEPEVGDDFKGLRRSTQCSAIATTTSNGTTPICRTERRGRRGHWRAHGEGQMQPSIDFLLCGRPQRSPAKMPSKRGVTFPHVQEAVPVRNLRFPFALWLCALRGGHLLQGDHRRGVLCEGSIVRIAPWTRFHYDGPDSGTTLRGREPRLELDAAVSSLRDHDRETSTRSSNLALTLQVAQAVFEQPWADWSAASAAQRVGLPAARLRAALFREGSALTAIVREQRLMRALILLTASDRLHADLTQLANSTGFGTLARFEAAFSQHFGCKASAAHTLSSGNALAWVSSPLAARMLNPKSFA